MLACAEPDYGGRIDYPDELSEIGRLQMMSLARQGANPQVGRKLKAILREAGIREVEVGILGGQWKNRRRQPISTWNGKCCEKTSETRSASGRWIDMSASTGRPGKLAPACYSCQHFMPGEECDTVLYNSPVPVVDLVESRSV